MNNNEQPPTDTNTSGIEVITKGTWPKKLWRVQKKQFNEQAFIADLIKALELSVGTRGDLEKSKAVFHEYVLNREQFVATNGRVLVVASHDANEDSIDHVSEYVGSLKTRVGQPIGYFSYHELISSISGSKNYTIYADVDLSRFSHFDTAKNQRIIVDGKRTTILDKTADGYVLGVLADDNTFIRFNTKYIANFLCQVKCLYKHLGGSLKADIHVPAGIGLPVRFDMTFGLKDEWSLTFVIMPLVTGLESTPPHIDTSYVALNR